MAAGLGASLIWLRYIAPLFALGLLFLLYFFRDPARRITPGENTLLSPADGRVVGVDEVEHPEYLSEPAVRISIFLSLLDCHINRSPCSGRVEYLNYREGRFHPAWTSAASNENEVNAVGIGSAGLFDRILVRQIAGIVARRIVWKPEIADRLSRGQKVGMIKFGSRTEVLVVKRTGFRPCVIPGDRVKAGVSILGEVSVRAPKSDTTQEVHV